MSDQSEIHEKPHGAYDNNALSRQYTVQLTSDQYERLFFQPTAAKGDLSKRLGNPTLLGLLGFLIPFSSTMFCLCGFKGASANSLAALSGIWYFYGGKHAPNRSVCYLLTHIRHVYGACRLGRVHTGQYVPIRCLHCLYVHQGYLT